MGSKVYLVEDVGNNPGRVYAVFNFEEDAEVFSDLLPEETVVVPRTVFYGQPSRQGFNE